MKGRKPTPTTLKILNGNPGRRPLNEGEPKAPQGLPPLPPNAHPRVAQMWDRLGPMLHGMGVLSLADELAFHLLCRAAADWLAFSDVCSVGSDVLVGENGTYWNMVASARDKAETRLIMHLREFGLTPSARTRIVAMPPAKGDEFDDFLSGKTGT